MNKGYVVAGLAAVGVAALVRRGASHCGSMDFGKMIERMPDDAPPKWMFRNISAIRQNTDRILELLDTEHHAMRGGAPRIQSAISSSAPGAT